MKKIENILLRGSAYTVLILVLFYLFAVLGQLVEPAITFPTFIIIVVFGFVISVCELVFCIKSLKTPIKVLIHYAVLLVAFCAIFIFSGNLDSKGPAAIFSAVVIFTFLYSLIFLIVYFARKGINAADKKIEKHMKKTKKDEKKPEYKSLYGKQD